MFSITGKRKAILILIVALMFIFVLVTVALAEDTSLVQDPGAKSIDDLAKPVGLVVNFIKYIGSTVIVGLGYWHAFGLTASGKNANKRVAAIEALGWTAVGAIVFFGAPSIAGVLKGIGLKI